MMVRTKLRCPNLDFGNCFSLEMDGSPWCWTCGGHGFIWTEKFVAWAVDGPL